MNAASKLKFTLTYYDGRGRDTRRGLRQAGLCELGMVKRASKSMTRAIAEMKEIVVKTNQVNDRPFV